MPDAISATSPDVAANARPRAASSAQASQERFLTLLVTQMRNQDPMNPLDNAQLTSQLAQISTVEGIEKLNTSIGAMSQGFSSLQFLGAASLIGREAAVEGDLVSLKGGKASGGFMLDAPADKVTITISDSAGKAVRTMELASGNAGLNTFSWDGKSDAGKTLAEGSYRISVQASSKGAEVPATPLAMARIIGATPDASGISLSLEGVGTVQLAQIKQIV